MKNLLMVLFVLLAVTGCGNTSEGEVVKLGVVGENNEAWEFVRDQLKAEGIQLEIVSFTDFVQPNTALAAGDIDLNAFQTIIFLENFNEENQTDLVPIANTVIAPLGIYSLKITELSEIQPGDRVSIPNDVTNGGRALLLLQTAGLIQVDPSAGHTPTVNDIIENNLNLDIVELDASQTARSLEDVNFAVINSGMAVDAGFIPTQDSIFLEPINEQSEPYFNIIATNQADQDHEIFQRIIALYQSDETKAIIEEVTKGSSIPLW